MTASIFANTRPIYDALDAAPREALFPMLQGYLAAQDFDWPISTPEDAVRAMAVQFFHRGGDRFNAKQLLRFIGLLDAVCCDPQQDIDGVPVKGCAGLVREKILFDLGAEPELKGAEAVKAAIELGLITRAEVETVTEPF